MVISQWRYEALEDSVWKRVNCDHVETNAEVKRRDEHGKQAYSINNNNKYTISQLETPALL